MFSRGLTLSAPECLRMGWWALSSAEAPRGVGKVGREKTRCAWDDGKTAFPARFRLPSPQPPNCSHGARKGTKEARNRPLRRREGGGGRGYIYICKFCNQISLQIHEKISQLSFSVKLVIRDSQVLAKLVVVTIFFIGWGQTARLQRVRQNTTDRIQTETDQQQTARLQRVRQNTADRILKFDKRYKAFEIAGYFQKHREIIG